jgi:hypothetical protein
VKLKIILLMAGFAIGYGVRSLVSLWRRREARRSLRTMTSHGLREANTRQMRIVTRDELGAS